MSLTPCPSCQRHVRLGTSACPFCEAALPEPAGSRARAALPSGVKRATLFAMGVTVAACSADSDLPTPVYGAPVPPAQGGASSMGGRAGSGGSNMGGAGGEVLPPPTPVYGAPVAPEGGSGGTGPEGQGGSSAGQGGSGGPLDGGATDAEAPEDAAADADEE